MTLSTAVVTNQHPQLQNHAQVGEIAVELNWLCLFYPHCTGGWKGRDIMFNTMLVEDNFLIMQLVESKLQDQFPSMEISEAADGVEALQKIKSHSPNLIFMDINLPGENGLELTRKIKADHPDIIVIILTSYDLPEYQGAAMRCKANYFLSKGSIGTGEISKLVGSILLEKGFNADGSDSKKGYS